MKTILQKTPQEHRSSNYENPGALSPLKKLLLLSIILLFVVVVRARLLDVPLERDEGEYAYMGQLMIQGIPPYHEAYNMKFPGTYLMYAGIMSLFGQTIRGIHLGFMLINCATVLLLFYLTRKLVNDRAAVVAAGTYAVLSLSRSVVGFAAHATHFVVLPALGGSLLLLTALDRNKPRLYFLSGVAFGLAYIMKQPGFFFFLFGASCIIYHLQRCQSMRSIRDAISHLALFTFGALLPFFTVVVWLYTAGVFGKFWFWTVQYAAKYVTQLSLTQAFDFFGNNLISVADGFWLVWIISALGFLALLLDRDLPAKRTFIILFTVFSFLSICPGYYFSVHYFITLLPAISILVGIFITYLNARHFDIHKSLLVRYAGAGLFLGAVLIGIVHQKGYFFKEDPVRVSKNIYGFNPFAESVEIAKFIEARSDKTDRIAVFGSEPQIYFYSRRHSASGHIYMYGLMEQHDYALSMQKEMIREIEAAHPKFVVVVSVPMSWPVQLNSDKFIVGWRDNYVQGSYRLVGVVDIISFDKTIYQWYDDAKKYIIQSPSHVLIFERKEDLISK
jgi:4-amino-4-deoxy-L-arabinose transferase-like glycosyltransferase